MDKTKIALLTTLILGLFIIVGALIALIVNKKQKVVDFVVGLAFGIITMLIITDLLPEIIESLSVKNIYIFIIFTFLGFIILKLLDNFIPDHEEHKMTNKELKDNLVHIGIITSIALILHNIIEGMAIYSSIITETELGIMITLGVGLHNIPLGMVISSTFYQTNQSISKTYLTLGIVSISTFVGGLIMFFLDLTTISEFVLGILLSITLGMLLFISFNELFPRIKESHNKKSSILGILSGIVILLIASIL